MRRTNILILLNVTGELKLGDHTSSKRRLFPFVICDMQVPLLFPRNSAAMLFKTNTNIYIYIYIVSAQFLHAIVCLYILEIAFTSYMVAPLASQTQ